MKIYSGTKTITVTREYHTHEIDMTNTCTDQDQHDTGTDQEQDHSNPMHIKTESPADRMIQSSLTYPNQYHFIGINSVGRILYDGYSELQYIYTTSTYDVFVSLTIDGIIVISDEGTVIYVISKIGKSTIEAYSDAVNYHRDHEDKFYQFTRDKLQKQVEDALLDAQDAQDDEPEQRPGLKKLMNYVMTNYHDPILIDCQTGEIVIGDRFFAISTGDFDYSWSYLYDPNLETIGIKIKLYNTGTKEPAFILQAVE